MARVLQTPEILAPAGDEDCLKAAVAAGADAVYFGLSDGFNARARAANFAPEDLPRTFDYLHERGVQMRNQEVIRSASAPVQAAREQQRLSRYPSVSSSLTSSEVADRLDSAFTAYSVSRIPSQPMLPQACECGLRVSPLPRSAIVRPALAGTR